MRSVGPAMKHVVPVLLAALAFAAPPAAQAWTPSVVERAMAVADSHWPSSPCHGAHSVQWMRGADLDALFPDEPGAEGRGDVGGCRVWIAWDRIDPAGVYRPGVYLCTILEHEYGHNAGLGHSDDPRDVMYGGGPMAAPDCVAAFRPVRTRRAWRWLRLAAAWRR